MEDKTYIFTREVKAWGVEAGDYYNEKYHMYKGGTEQLLKEGVIEEEVDECEYCGGKDGEHEDITTMETVYAGEPHMAPIGSQTCPNALPDDEHEHDE